MPEWVTSPEVVFPLLALSGVAVVFLALVVAYAVVSWREGRPAQRRRGES